MASLDGIKAFLEDQSQSLYNPDTIGKLEAYVTAQVSGKAPYYFDANRILLKLYSFYPESANDSIIAQVLLLSLLEFPSTDLLALLCLVANQTGEPTATIVRCASLLDSCRFSEFWTNFAALESDATLGSLVKSSKEKLCKSIAKVLALSYRTAPLAFVQASLTKEENVSNYVEKVDGDIVYFPPTADNTKRDRVFQEGVTFGEISNLINKTSVARE